MHKITNVRDVLRYSIFMNCVTCFILDSLNKNLTKLMSIPRYGASGAPAALSIPSFERLRRPKFPP